MKNNKGVTLVALVITIIVLLILAGVSLAMLTGDSGILTNADKAKEETLAANAEGSVQMAYMDIKTEVYALETAKSSVQSVDMTAAKMKEIAEKYCSDATVTESTTEASITIKYDDSVKISEAKIKYDPDSTTGRVSIEWVIPGEDNDETGDDTTGDDTTGDDTTGDDTTGDDTTSGAPEDDGETTQPGGIQDPDDEDPGHDDVIYPEEE